MIKVTRVSIYILLTLALIAVAPNSSNAATGQLQVNVVDRETGRPLPVRMHLMNAHDRPQRAGRAPFHADHFVFDGSVVLRLPLGTYKFEMERGPEYLTRFGHFVIDNFADDTKTVDMKRFIDMSEEGWWSGDIDIRRPPIEMPLLMSADDLHFAVVPTWSDTPSSDIRNYWSSHDLPKKPVVYFDGNRRCYDLLGGIIGRPGAELLVIGLTEPLDVTPLAEKGEWPAAAYRILLARAAAQKQAETAASDADQDTTESEPNRPSAAQSLGQQTAAPQPMEAPQQGVIQWPGEDEVTPLDGSKQKVVELPADLPPGHDLGGSLWVDSGTPAARDLPMLVALGLIDSVRVVGGELGREKVLPERAETKPRDRLRYPDARGAALWAQQVYFNLLECGLRLPPTAASVSGRSPNPVGYNRTYVHFDGPFTSANWWKALRAGRAFITNGPLLSTTVEGHRPGHVFQSPSGQPLELEIGLTLSTRQPITYLDIIKNGRIEESIRFEDYAKTGRLPKLSFDESGWFIIRAVTDLPNTYRFSMTAPYYVEIGYERRVSAEAAQFFIDWVYERAGELEIEDPAIKQKVVNLHRRAYEYWKGIKSRANAE